MSLVFGSDTSPEAAAILIEGYRRMPLDRKLQKVLDLNRTGQLLALMRIRADHPNASDHELKMRLASLWIDPAIMRDVFGWDPAVYGY